MRYLWYQYKTLTCFLTGIQYQQGQPVYPERNSPDEWNGVFPDGTPFRGHSGRKPRYIYVWKTWGIYNINKLIEGKLGRGVYSFMTYNF